MIKLKVFHIKKNEREHQSIWYGAQSEIQKTSHTVNPIRLSWDRSEHNKNTELQPHEAIKYKLYYIDINRFS